MDRRSLEAAASHEGGPVKRYHLIAVALAGSIASACSQTSSLPSSGVDNGVLPTAGNVADTSAQIVSANDLTPEAVGGADASTPCKHPEFPTICVKQGHSATLGIEITCTKNGKPAKCGTVTWSTKTSDERLTWSFVPNPGNPTTETIHATKTLPVGKYSQSISTKCSNVPDCPKGYVAPIYVLAK
jgi:hypothetical protein